MKKIFAHSTTLRDVPTSYCPGCTHGVIHRITAEVIDELGIRENTVGVGPVGCSVFVYELLDCDMFSASHGRASAVATGAKRARPDLVVFAYQGDGDLASIGIAEIIYAANRGEKFTTIFVNNAIYGMTGGQMAPTTLPGQRATTCPTGRDVEQVGYPIRMTELLSSLRTPGFIARVSTHSAKHTIEAKKVIKQAFQHQLENRCFSFVEVLSTCSTNWGLSPREADAWVGKEMVAYYPLGIYKRPEDVPNPDSGGAA
jgi:2-oxoglutarate/2-oxoacid ferredoxin oxidoreductase subunit beta